MSSSSISASVSVSGFSSPGAFSCYEPSVGSASPSYIDIVLDAHKDYLPSYQSPGSAHESALPESPSGQLSRGIDAYELIHKLKKLIFPNEPERWNADFDSEPAPLSAPSPIADSAFESLSSSRSSPDSEETFEVVDPSSGWETASDMSLETPTASPSLKGEELEIDDFGYLPKDLFDDAEVPTFSYWDSPATYVEEIDTSPLDRILGLVSTPMPEYHFVAPVSYKMDTTNQWDAYVARMEAAYKPSFDPWGEHQFAPTYPTEPVVLDSYNHIVADIHKIAERQLAAAGLLGFQT